MHRAEKGKWICSPGRVSSRELVFWTHKPSTITIGIFGGCSSRQLGHVSVTIRRLANTIDPSSWAGLQSLFHSGKVAGSGVGVGVHAQAARCGRTVGLTVLADLILAVVASAPHRLQVHRVSRSEGNTRRCPDCGDDCVRTLDRIAVRVSGCAVDERTMRGPDARRHDC